MENGNLKWEKNCQRQRKNGYADYFHLHPRNETPLETKKNKKIVGNMYSIRRRTPWGFLSHSHKRIFVFVFRSGRATQQTKYKRERENIIGKRVSKLFSACNVNTNVQQTPIQKS